LIPIPQRGFIAVALAYLTLPFLLLAPLAHVSYAAAAALTLKNEYMCGGGGVYLRLLMLVIGSLTLFLVKLYK
jgi:hypothetical protein